MRVFSAFSGTFLLEIFSKTFYPNYQAAFGCYEHVLIDDDS